MRHGLKHTARAAVVAGALGLAIVAGPAQAAGLTVADFLGKVAALKAKGMMAMFSPDIGVLKRETLAAFAAVKADHDARQAAGKPLLHCPPKGSTMNSNDLIAAFERMPAAERGIGLRDGVQRVLSARYPCR